MQARAEVNVINSTGDTPLHRAAYTGREVSSLLSHCSDYARHFVTSIRWQMCSWKSVSHRNGSETWLPMLILEL